LQAIA